MSANEGPGAQPDRPGSPAWHALSVDEALAALGVDARTGLSTQAAARLLEQHGTNQIAADTSTTWPRLLARQFSSVLIAILAVGSAVSFAIGETLDGSAILAILVLNGLLGFFQEWRAERALAALQGMLSRRCTVVRDGAEQQVDSELVVPGDVVLLGTGSRVPADLRLVQVADLEVDESALTGESVAVAKDLEPVPAQQPLAQRSSMAWMGTAVVSGHARGVVVNTGLATEFGQVSELTRSVERDPTPLQRQLSQLGAQLGLLAVGVACAVAILGWSLGRPALEMFMTGISLAVAVVPEGLPAVVTVTLGLGVRQMVRRRALPRRLQATEALGATTTILTDKTGTLTENEMTVTRLELPAGSVEVSGTGYVPEGDFLRQGQTLAPLEEADLRALLEVAVTCNHASVSRGPDGSWERVGEPTEAALAVLARKAGLARPASGIAFELPFSSTRKRMTVVTGAGGDPRVALVKGAPDVLLGLCRRVLENGQERDLDAATRERLAEGHRALAGQGMRVLAFARRELPAGLEGPSASSAESIEADLTWLGRCPPRWGAPAAPGSG